MTSAASAYSFSGTRFNYRQYRPGDERVGTLTVNNSNSYSGETDHHGGNLVIKMPAASGRYQRPKRDGYRAHCQRFGTVAVHSGGTLSGALIALGGLPGSTGRRKRKTAADQHTQWTFAIGGSKRHLSTQRPERSPPVPWRSAQGDRNRLHDAKRRRRHLANASQLSVGITGSAFYDRRQRRIEHGGAVAGFFRLGGFDATGIGSFTKAASSWSTSYQRKRAYFASIAAGGTGTYTLQ